MNANELADKLLVASNDMEHNFHVSDWKLLFECALVMRNQQAKLECYERLADASEMASNPMSEKGREALKNVREMKTIMTQDEEILLRELAGGRCTIQKVTAAIGPMSLWSKDGLEAEIRKAVEAEREACAKVADEYANGLERNYSEIIADLIRARSNT